MVPKARKSPNEVSPARSKDFPPVMPPRIYPEFSILLVPPSKGPPCLGFARLPWYCLQRDSDAEPHNTTSRGLTYKTLSTAHEWGPQWGLMCTCKTVCQRSMRSLAVCVRQPPGLGTCSTGTVRMHGHGGGPGVPEALPLQYP